MNWIGFGSDRLIVINLSSINYAKQKNSLFASDNQSLVVILSYYWTSYHTAPPLLSFMPFFCDIISSAQIRTKKQTRNEHRKSSIEWRWTKTFEREKKTKHEMPRDGNEVWTDESVGCRARPYKKNRGLHIFHPMRSLRQTLSISHATPSTSNLNSNSTELNLNIFKISSHTHSLIHSFDLTKQNGANRSKTKRGDQTPRIIA